MKQEQIRQATQEFKDKLSAILGVEYSLHVDIEKLEHSDMEDIIGAKFTADYCVIADQETDGFTVTVKNNNLPF